MKSKIHYFDNFKIVILDDCTRECVRFYKGNGMIAIIQKNGIIAINGTNYFRSINPVSKYKVAQCLYGLKLISQERLESYKADYELDKRKIAIHELKYDAERLGYKVIKKQ